MTTRTALSVRDLSVNYAGMPAVSGYSVDLLQGTLTVILGRNGAGKTSTLRGITGFLAHESGSVRGTVSVAGKVVGSTAAKRNPLRMSRMGVGLVAERDKVFSNLVVRDQLRLVASSRTDIEEILGYFPRLGDRSAVRAGLLSGGERQMLATALVLLRQPQVLLVDELSLGLAPVMVRELMAYLRRLADERGLTILAADQAAHAALEVADAVQVLDSGALVASGTIGSVDVESLLATYLGRHEG